MRSSIRSALLQPKTLLMVYALVALAVSLQALMLPPHIMGERPYKEYNNYVIFKQAFYHLVAGQNLYVAYPAEQWDLYKYSPAFALAMGTLAHLPDYIGLTIWNLVNVLTLFAAVRLLPFKDRTQSLLLWLLLPELVTSIQNAQSNGIMAALFIAAYCCLQRRAVGWAALWLVIATFIKVYGAVGFCLFLFYPGKLKFIGYATLFTVALAIVPVLVTPTETLIGQYRNWGVMIAEDQSTSYGLSVMGVLHSWFGLVGGKTIVSGIGIILFLIPLMRFSMYQNQLYRMLLLAGMMVWVIIFNHKAESPGYIIAVAGIGIWYFCRPQRMWRNLLLAVVVVFTCLSPTDLFPPFIRLHYFQVYAIKAVPCILAWCIIFADLMRLKKDEPLPANMLIR